MTLLECVAWTGVHFTSRRWRPTARGRLAPGLALVVLLLGCAPSRSAPSWPVQGAPPARVPRVGYVTSALREDAFAAGGFHTFLKALTELGWVEGDNVIIEHRASRGDESRWPSLIEDLVTLPVDVLVIGDSRALPLAISATSSLPIVTAVGDAFGAGLVASLARPDRNLTGVTNLATGLSGKRLETLKDAVPNISRVAVLANPNDPGTAGFWRETQATAQMLGLQVFALEVRAPTDFTTAFEAVDREGADALLVLPDPLTNLEAETIVSFATRSQLPSMFGIREPVDSGGLLFYGPSRTYRFQRSAALVDKILRGAKPADIPVEQAARFDLVINLKTATALGLSIPPNVLLRATAAIQ
jgi:putative ABC transport system substrate-binding protein